MSCSMIHMAAVFCVESKNIVTLCYGCTPSKSSLELCQSTSGGILGSDGNGLGAHLLFVT